MKRRFRWFCFLLMLSLFAGSLWAVHRRGGQSFHSSPAMIDPLPVCLPPSEKQSHQEIPAAKEKPEETLLLPDLSGLAVGSGKVDPLLPEMGSDARSLLRTEKPVVIDLPPCVHDVAAQLEGLKKEIDTQTLKAAESGLNALPGVSASPDRAGWSLGGQEVKLEISIPAEDVKIDLGELFP